MMLKEVRIQDFRALRAVTAPLRPLTVLVGPNDSGKSAFLAALQYLVHAFPFQPNDHWRQDRALPIRLTGWITNGSKVSWTGDPGSVGGGQMRPAALFHLSSRGMTAESGGHQDEQGPPDLASNGDGLPTLLDYLLRRDRGRFDRLLHAARGLVPGLEDLSIATPEPATRRLDLILDNGLRLPASQVSSGVRLLLFYLALAYHPRPPRLILVEEPETGIHPKRLREVVQLLRDLTEGKHGEHPVQVVLATHSPHLLDLIDVNKDQVLVFSRQEDGSRTAEPADAERLATFLDEFSLGEVWFNRDEAGLVARKP